MRGWCLLAVALFACTPDPPQRPPRPHVPRPPPPELPTSREKPQAIVMKQVAEAMSGWAHLKPTAAGSWWYSVVLAPRSNKLTTAEFSLRYRGRAGRATFELIDEAGHVRGAPEEKLVDDTNHVEVALAEPDETLGTFLVHVTTTEAADCDLNVETTTRNPPPVVHPPCDPDHIDRTNPNCTNVYPACVLNHPDYKNPNCCRARCNLGRLSCRAKVLAFLGKRLARIDLSASDEIMVGARGEFAQRPGGSTQILVTHVDEHDSVVELLYPNSIDLAHPERAHVVLHIPDECLHD